MIQFAELQHQSYRGATPFTVARLPWLRNLCQFHCNQLLHFTPTLVQTAFHGSKMFRIRGKIEKKNTVRPTTENYRGNPRARPTGIDVTLKLLEAHKSSSNQDQPDTELHSRIPLLFAPHFHALVQLSAPIATRFSSKTPKPIS